MAVQCILGDSISRLTRGRAMSSSASTAPFAANLSFAGSNLRRIPWYVWSCVVASTTIMAGLYWDISWHETIGRDTFWTPAHLLIQFAALLTAVSSSYLIFSTTFGGNMAAKQASVNVLGFRGPLGAFICAWGGVIMILGQMNRAEGAQRKHLEWMLVISGGFMLVLDMLFKLEYTNRIFMHSAIMYTVVSIWTP